MPKTKMAIPAGGCFWGMVRVEQHVVVRGQLLAYVVEATQIGSTFRVRVAEGRGRVFFAQQLCGLPDPIDPHFRRGGHQHAQNIRAPGYGKGRCVGDNDGVSAHAAIACR